MASRVGPFCRRPFVRLILLSLQAESQQREPVLHLGRIIGIGQKMTRPFVSAGHNFNKGTEAHNYVENVRSIFWPFDDPKRQTLAVVRHGVAAGVDIKKSPRSRL